MKYKIELVGVNGVAATMGFVRAGSKARAIALTEFHCPSPEGHSYLPTEDDYVVSKFSFDNEFDDLAAFLTIGIPDLDDADDELSDDLLDDGELKGQSGGPVFYPELSRRYPIFKSANLTEMQRWASTADLFQWRTEIQECEGGHLLKVGWHPIHSREEWEYFWMEYLVDQGSDLAEFPPEEATYRELSAFPWIENSQGNEIDDDDDDEFGYDWFF